jgi:lysophospholipase L1-like esterase
LILGDSCSRVAGSDYPYSVYLQRILGPETWEVLNASVPGYTSHQGRRWLESQLLDAEPDVVVIYFGWNDHWRTTGRTDLEYEASRRFLHPRILTLLRGRPRTPPFRVPRSDYRENLEWMVRQVAARDAIAILVLAPHRFTEAGRRRYVEDHYLVAGDDPEALHRAYLDTVREFAGREGVWLLGADAIFARLGEVPALLRADGIHFTETGHQLMAILLEAQIRTAGAGADGSAAPELLQRVRTHPGVPQDNR